MKKTGIMTDSHSGILNEEAERLGIKVLPMPFYIGEKYIAKVWIFPEMNFMTCFEKEWMYQLHSLHRQK